MHLNDTLTAAAPGIDSLDARRAQARLSELGG